MLLRASSPRKIARFCIFALAFAAAALPGRGLPASTGLSRDVALCLREMLAPGGVELSVEGEPLHSRQFLAEFYGGRQFMPLWSTDGGVLPRAKDLLHWLSNSYREGLDPRDYHAAAIESALGDLGRRPADRKRLAELDLLLTDAYFNFGFHCYYGRLKPPTYERRWYRGGSSPVSEALYRALESADVGEAFRQLLPSHPGYTALRRELAAYSAILQEGGWPVVPGVRALRAGARGERVSALRRRLRVGDLTGGLEADLFDAELAAAVRRFQRRHGLREDGIAGRATLEALNVPVKARIKQIALNMERWRWLSHDLGRRYVFVNIPDFRLEVVEDGVPVMQMRVVVGKPYWDTPVFSSKMTYIVINPSWTIPAKIALEEIVPDVLKDPSYLSRQGIAVYPDRNGSAAPLDPSRIDWSKLDVENFPYRLVQKPGPSNPLGHLKFVLPNPFSVYLHDTPYRRHFDEDVRALSHGCIRIEKPLELAEYLLRGSPGWDRLRIESEIKKGQEKSVSLPSPVDVHFIYLTAWADRDGARQFRRDIYGRDERLGAAMAAICPSGGILLK